MFERKDVVRPFSFISSFLTAIACAVAFWSGLGSPVWAGTGWSRCDAKIAAASKAGKITVVSTCNQAGAGFSHGARSRGTKKPPKGAASPGSLACPGDGTEAECWAWSEIKQGKEPADLNKYCDTLPLDPKDAELDKRWEDKCRALSARFLEDVLTRAPWKDEVAFEGVRIVGAKIEEDVDLEDAKLTRPIIISDSRINGKIKLSRARTDNLISLEGSRMDNDFDAAALQSESNIVLRRIVTDSQVSLSNAKIAGDVDLTGARVANLLNAEYMHVSGSLNIRPQGETMQSQDEPEVGFQDIDLKNAKIDGDLLMAGAKITDELNLKEAKIIGDVDVSGAQIDGWLFAEDFHVSGLLDMRPGGQRKASFHDVDLRHAKIDGNVEMAGAQFNGELGCNSMQVGGILSMSEVKKETIFEKRVDLGGADIKKQVHMFRAHFNGPLDAHHMHVGDDLIMRNAEFAKDVDVDMSFTHVDGNLDLRSATILAKLFNLQSTSVQGQFRLGRNNEKNENKEDGPPNVWNGILKLSNAQVGYLADAEEGAWPDPDGHPRVLLDGFAFTHLGDGIRAERRKPFFAMLAAKLSALVASLGRGETEHEALPDAHVLRHDLEAGNLSLAAAVPSPGLGAGPTTRGMEWWDKKWARLDDYSPTPYLQLTSALTSLGYRDEANEIRYLGRKRAREAACGEAWLGFSCFFQTALEYGAGYGIGMRTIYSVLLWVCVFSLVGAGLLWRFGPGVPNEQHRFRWCLGASLVNFLPATDKLLPAVPISKEFGEEVKRYFDDPKTSGLKPWLSVVFTGFSVLGWLLAAVVAVLLLGLA